MALTKEDLQAIKFIVDDSLKTGIKPDIDELKTRMDVVEDQIGAIKGRLDDVESDIKDIKVVQIEGCIIPVLNDVHQYQKDVYKRYHDGANLFDEKIALIDMTAETVARHSKQIKKLQELNQA